MKRLALLVALALAPQPAEAYLAGWKSGMYAYGAGGFGSGGVPWQPGVGWVAGFGGFIGPYDSSFALGRQFGFGAALRQDVTFGRAPSFRTAPMVELRGGIDLLTLGIQGSLMGGPLIASRGGGGHDLVGGTVRGAFSVKARFIPTMGLLLRLEGGLDVIDGRSGGTAALMLGFEWASLIPRPR